ENRRIVPIKDSDVLKMKALKVKMKRTLEVKDIPGWKPTVCDYWDTTYYTYSGKTIRLLYIAFNPIQIDDQYNSRNCAEDGGPRTGMAFDYKPTHKDTVDALREAQQPKPYFPSPSDSIISTFNSEGYLLSRITKNHSSGNAPPREYYYYDDTNRCIAHSIYNYYGLKDSIRVFYNTAGKIIQWKKVIQHSMIAGGVVREKMHFSWDTTIVLFNYDDHGNCTSYNEKNVILESRDSAGRSLVYTRITQYHYEQTYDPKGRQIAFINFASGKADTTHWWRYSDSANQHFTFAYTRWNKIPTVKSDSDVLDPNGIRIGTVFSLYDGGRRKYSVYMHDKEIARYDMSLEFRKTEQVYKLEDSGNVIRKISQSSRSTYSPVKEVYEYRYDAHGLLSDAFYSYADSRRPPKPIHRHLKYLYTYQR
ncbi:MAG TPA: hypothetical protein VFO76_05010, partial [Candidatus Kapabacteria bacterium]|nr:hypothetical protein [Candidatus Kapabacteria bacterium]